MKLLFIVVLGLAAGFIGGLAARYVLAAPRYAPQSRPERPVRVGRYVPVGSKAIAGAFHKVRMSRSNQQITAAGRRDLQFVSPGATFGSGKLRTHWL
jgi:hypothetical protein